MSGIISNGAVVMKRSLVLFLLLKWMSITACAQEQVPAALLGASHCLAAKNFLPRSKANVLRFGYLIDTKSYPGGEAIYVVEYPGGRRSEGFVFTVFLARRGHRRVFNIQNNAKFARSKGGFLGVDFLEDPLGGIWTQTHLVAAIKQIERQPQFWVRAKDLLTPSASVECESYIDPFIADK